MAPTDASGALLSVDAPGGLGQALSGAWPPGMNCMPGYLTPTGGCELLSTSVLSGGEAQARFTSLRASGTAAEDAASGTEGEAGSRTYRPGELLQRVAKLQPPRFEDSASGGSTPERLTRPDSEGLGSSGESDSEGSPPALPGAFHKGDASREQEALAAGLPAVPTVGSVGHWLGTCKPCAFAFKGCQNGSACLFCHLCLPGEKQRRRKLSKLANKEPWMQMQRQGESLG